MKINYYICIEDESLSINSILKNKIQISTKLLTKLIKLKKIYLNNIPVDTRIKAKSNDLLTIDFNYAEDNSSIVPTKMDLNIIYEDEWFLVLNKPAGIAIHPSRMHFSDSLSNGVKYYFDLINLSKKIRPINRLDLDTSGLVVFAKCEYVQECCIKQMQENNFKKTYICLVNGFLTPLNGKIDLPIARKENSIIERYINSNGRKSITYYKTLQKFNNYSLVECTLETGRTHQIRVHMSAIDHSLLGDTLYGNSSNIINRQALHSYKISFIHPVTFKKIELIAPIPNDFML